ncbi:hypothetical protein HFP71_33290 [Streptomyces sp. ARC32]
MRRTLFAFPVDLLPAVMPSAAARVAAAERARFIRDCGRAGAAADGAAWLERAREDVEAALARSTEALSTAQLRKTRSSHGESNGRFFRSARSTAWAC